MIYKAWDKWLTQQKRWVPTITLMPFLYLFGWLIVQPISFIIGTKYTQSLSLIGTFITFFFFLLLLPRWIKIRWGNSKAWNAIGLYQPLKLRSFFVLLRGLLLAFSFIIIVLVPLSLGPWVQSVGGINLDQFLNAIFLGTFVGIAEELIFRGWLLGEMVQLLGSRNGVIVQSMIFSLAHIRFKLPFNELILLLLGLFLLGLILVLRRSLDQGSLWGAIGLHGGLVGGWFLINSGTIDIAENVPIWLVGPGASDPNPIGSLGAMISMALIIFYQRKDFAKTGRFFASTVKASSKVDSP